MDAVSGVGWRNRKLARRVGNDWAETQSVIESDRKVRSGRPGERAGDGRVRAGRLCVGAIQDQAWRRGRGRAAKRFHDIGADLVAERQRRVGRELEVDPAINTALGRLVRGLGETCVAARDTVQALRRRRETGGVAKKVAKHGRRGTAEAAMAFCVFREVRRGEQRLPGRVGDQRRVAGAPQFDRGDRAPRLIAIFAVPGGDSSIRLGHVKFGKQLGALHERIAGRGQDGRGDLVPLPRRRIGAGLVVPEFCDFSLVGRAGRAGTQAERLRLIDRRRVGSAGQIGRRRR